MEYQVFHLGLNLEQELAPGPFSVPFSENSAWPLKQNLVKGLLDLVPGS